MSGIMGQEVEIMFNGLTITIKTEEPAAIFRVIKALENDGREPEFRYYDEELQEKTCWQPTKRAA